MFTFDRILLAMAY